MRVLFTSTGYSGHLLPLVPLARACVRAGQDVLVAVPESRRAAVERLGLRAAGFADAPAAEAERRLAELARLPPLEGHEVVVAKGFAGGHARAALPGMLDLVDGWRPDVIVRESYEFAGAVAGERAGVPVARVGLGVAAAEEEIVALGAAPVDDLRALAGLPADPGASALRSEPLFTTVPRAFDDPSAARAACRFRGQAGPAMALPEWWPGSSDPLVYVTFGSVAASLPLFPRLYRDVIAAAADMPARVLMTVGNDGDPAELGPLPANVRVERWVDQDAIAPYADAVVCHGGFGSVLGALGHGLPQVVVPLFAGDQWRNAERIEQVGAGLALTGAAGATRTAFEPPGPDAIAALPGAVRRVLDEPRFTHAASRIAREMAALPPFDAAPPLLNALRPVAYLNRCA